MAKILITGSEGFIGSHLSEKPNKESLWTLDVKGEGSRHFKESIEDFDRFDEFDKIYHLAAVSDPRVCEKQKEKSWFVNVEGTRNLISQLGEDQDLIFASSGHVYGKREGKREENDGLNPDNFYGLTKKISEDLIEMYSAEKGFNYTIFRLFNVYGPGQPQGFLVPDIINRAKSEEVVTVRSPDSKISPVFVSDVVDILSADLPRGVYNVSSSCTSVKAIYKMICSKLDVDMRYRSEENSGWLCGDNSWLLEDYNREITPLTEGIEKTVEYYI